MTSTESHDSELAKSTSPTPATPSLGACVGVTPGAKGLWRDRVLVFCLAALVMLPMLGSIGLWDPWETHYGEVARTITEQNDWISTWWGSRWQNGSGRIEGAQFYSKPILLMWMMAMGMSVFGVNEWGVRIGVCLVAILGVASVYAMGRSVFSKRVGALMALVLGTSPFYFMLGRQAQTDMPFVGLMTIGMSFFMMASFGKDRDAPADKLSYGLTFGWLGLLTIPQVILLISGLSSWRGDPSSMMKGIIGPHSQTGLILSSGLLGVSAALGLAACWKRWHATPDSHVLARRLALGALGVLWVPLLVLLGLSFNGGQPLRNLNGWFVWGGTQAAIYATCFGVATYLTIARPILENRRLHYYLFYAFLALATLGKGLLGFMLPGAIIFFYILLTREWRMLKRVELFKGSLIFIAISFPWYAAMLIRHTFAFWNRFFVHDHFKRLASGVHAVDEGSFEHFIRWLGYGLLPWIGVLPGALGRLFADRSVLTEDNDQSRATLFLVIWAVFAMTLFTLSSTKFHHYIFPVLPALSLLIALGVDDLLKHKRPAAWPLYLIGIGVFAVLVWDLMDTPYVLKNLFVYKYKRSWFDPTLPGTFRWIMVALGVPMALGLGLMLWRSMKAKALGLGLMGLSTIVFTYFVLNTYMGWYSDSWSQRELWDTYKSLCTPMTPPPNSDPRKPYCEEPPMAYNLTWRGETFYTHNLVVPISKDEDFSHFLANDGAQGFYAMMEMPRYKGAFQRKLPAKWRKKSCVVYNRNQRYLLVKVPAEPNDPQCIQGKLKREVRTAADQR